MVQEQQTAEQPHGTKGALRAATEEQAVLQYLPVADRLARRMARPGPDQEDLVQVARLALVKAARRFDPQLNTSFLAFAEPTIIGELKRYLRDQTWVIQPPRGIQELQVQAQREHALLSQVLGREPRLEELAQHLGRPVREVAEALSAASGRRPESLDALYEGRDLHERLPAAPEDGFAALDDSMQLTAALQQLDAEERQLLRLRYFEDRSQQDIGTRMRMTQMQVSRALSRILTKLHRHMVGHRPTTTRHETRAA